MKKHLYIATLLAEGKNLADEKVLFAADSHPEATRLIEEVMKVKWQGYRLYWVEHIATVEQLTGRGSFVAI
jgi:hypothetical protein